MVLDKINNKVKGYTVKIAMVVFVLILCISFSFAAQDVFGFHTDVDWILIAYLVILIVALLLGIAFMISKVFAMHELEAWTREEAMNLIISIAILVLFTAFVGVAEQIANSLSKDVLSSSVSASASGNISYWQYIPNEGRWKTIETSNPSCEYPCYIYMARGFLGSLYEKYGESLKSIAQYYFVSVFYSTQSIGSGVDFTWGKFKFEFGIGFPLNAGLTIYNNILATVVSEYLKIITAIKMQEIALVYLSSLAGMFFILGIISRSVWFLRKFGGLFVAAGIGLYLIFPMVYVLSWYTIDRSAIIFEVDLPQPVSSDDPLSFFTGGIGGLGNVDLLFTRYNDNGSVISIGMLDSLGRSYIPIIVVPILAIFTTLGFIRHFSPMIGGDPEIAGLTRII
ncbi:MAG: hypothetical protein QXY17_00245 [Candidatus Micrarchaeia archaeon]